MRFAILELRCAVVVLLGMALLIGCDTASDASEGPAAPPRANASGHGIITGNVIFTGPAPVMNPITVPCHEGPVSITEESVVVNDNGTLRNVFVYLEGAPATDGRSAGPALLDQVECRYVPHVIGVQVGQPLRIRSSDATLHNVHSLARKNRPFNFGMTSAGDEKTVTFAAAEFVPVKCDVHPWMTAYIGVFENPWFDVTGDDGSFQLANVPAGSYTLVTWHERYGRLEQSVSISDGRPLTVNFQYKAPEG